MNSHIDAKSVIEALSELRDDQLRQWPAAMSNYAALGNVERKAFSVGEFDGALQFNPARAVSTGAKVDAASISKRPCFLCHSNRPKEQNTFDILPGWELLVNPFPIFPLHFTIASTMHQSQAETPVEMAAMAEKMQGMTIFFNGARAGASAPDHLHCQAVLTEELPLMRYLEEGGNPDFLPFAVEYHVITPDIAGMIALNEIPVIKGRDAVTGKEDAGLVNVYMWIGADGLLHTAVVRRSAHRPSCYPDDESGRGFMVSPGAVDMAGIIILPRKEDFDAITSEDVAKIWSETAMPPMSDSDRPRFLKKC